MTIDITYYYLKIVT